MPRPGRPAGVRASAGVGGLAALAALVGCASSTACPQDRAASGISVDASAYFAAHPAARMLCVDGGDCVTVGTHRPPLVFVAVQGGGTSEVRVSISGQQRHTLLDTATRVPIRMLNSACGVHAYTGSVTVTRTGAIHTNQ